MFRTQLWFVKSQEILLYLTYAWLPPPLIIYEIDPPCFALCVLCALIGHQLCSAPPSPAPLPSPSSLHVRALPTYAPLPPSVDDSGSCQWVNLFIHGLLNACSATGAHRAVATPRRSHGAAQVFGRVHGPRSCVGCSGHFGLVRSFDAEL